MSKHLTPLEVVETLIAPVKDLGRILGFHEKSAYAWGRGSQWRDPGDMPPRANRAALKYAGAHDIPLNARHLICGADWSEVEQLLAGMGMTDGEIAQHRNRIFNSRQVAAE